VLLIRPDNGNALNNLAWVFATSPDDSLRDGSRAVQLAEQATRVSGGRMAMVWRTLAAAYAENGRFADAIQTAQRAIELARNQGNASLAAELQNTIALYETGKPLRDSSLTNGIISPRKD
jgi:tetratricopeptide (TPR) repeat protein